MTRAPASRGALIDAAALAPHLTTRWLGRTVHAFAELDSTNTTARELAAVGAPHGTVVIADAQRRGRGRMGRSWVSPPGRNLYCSAVLRCALPADQAAQISLVAGVATCDALRAWCRAELKWPNDVVAGGRKLAGMLAEMVGDGAEQVVILGIGVNVDSTAEDFPPELRAKAGSLRLATGATVDRAQVLARLLGALEVRYDQWQREGLGPIVAAWRELAPCMGQPIRVLEPGDRVVEGTVIDIDGDGALRIRLVDGREHRVIAGDVTVLDGYPARA